MTANRIKKALAAALRDKSGRQVAPLTVIREIAASESVSVRELEVELLKEGIIPQRYLRNIGAFGTEGQAKLLLSSAAVVGCGGLGGWIVELMARAGVGRIALVDGDAFSDSNLNRQLLCTESNLGRNKAEAAAARVREINGAIETIPCPVMLTEDNAVSLLEKNCVVFDALDNLPSRLLLLKTAQTLGIPIIHGAIAGWRGQVCALVSGSGVLTSLWEGAGDKIIETSAGAPGFTPAAVASMQAAMGIRILLGKPIPTDLFWLDVESPALEKLALH